MIFIIKGRGDFFLFCLFFLFFWNKKMRKKYTYKMYGKKGGLFEDGGRFDDSLSLSLLS